MEREWPGFNRVEGVDGQFMLGRGHEVHTDVRGTIPWGWGVREQLVEEGVLHDSSPLHPDEVACTISHMGALRHFLESEHSHLVLLEDDVSPLRDWDWTRDCILTTNDILYLFSPDHPGEKISLYPVGHPLRGQVRWVRSHMAVMYTRRGAEAALEAMQPIYYMHDTQAFMRICKSRTRFRNLSEWLPSDMPALPQIEMHGLRKGLVEENELAQKSTKPGGRRVIRKVKG